MAALRITVVTLLAALVLAGCGDAEMTPTPADSTTTTPEPLATTADGAGGGEAGQAGETAADEQRPLTISETVEIVLTSAAAPSVICGELVTEAYVRAAYGAREGCLAAQKPGALANSVKAGVGLRDGATVSVTVVPKGGPYDGVDVRVELVRDGDGWRVDSLFADVPAGP